MHQNEEMENLKAKSTVATTLPTKDLRSNSWELVWKLLFFHSFFLGVNITRCPHTWKMGLIPVWSSACLWPQSASNGFRTLVIEASGNSPVGGSSLPTAPRLVVIIFLLKIKKDDLNKPDQIKYSVNKIHRWHMKMPKWEY